MKSLQDLITHLQARVVTEKEVIAKLAKKLVYHPNPGYALSWSIDSFQAAAKIEVFNTIISMAAAVDGHSDEKWIEYSDIDFPRLPGESRFDWFKRYVRFQTPSKMDFSIGTMETGNLYRHCLNEVWKDVATQSIGIFYGF